MQQLRWRRQSFACGVAGWLTNLFFHDSLHNCGNLQLRPGPSDWIALASPSGAALAASALAVPVHCFAPSACHACGFVS
eukprot:2103663-Alexandrium_andersonii.AAC.1